MEWAYRRGSRRFLEARAGPAARSRLAVPRASWVHPPKASPTDWSPQETPPPPPRPLNPKKVRRSSSPTESPWPSALFVPHGHPRLKALTPCEARRAKDAPSALRPPPSARRAALAPGRPQYASRPPLGVSAALIRGFSCLQLAFSALPPLPISALRPFRAPCGDPPNPPSPRRRPPHRPPLAGHSPRARTGRCTSNRFRNHGVKGPSQKAARASPAASQSSCFPSHCSSSARASSKFEAL